MDLVKTLTTYSNELNKKLNIPWLTHSYEEKGEFIVGTYAIGRDSNFKIYFLTELGETELKQFVKETLYRISNNPHDADRILYSLMLYHAVLPLVNEEAGVAFDAFMGMVTVYVPTARLTIKTTSLGLVTELYIEELISEEFHHNHVWAHNREHMPEVLRSVFFEAISSVVMDAEYTMSTDELEVNDACDRISTGVATILFAMKALVGE